MLGRDLVEKRATMTLSVENDNWYYSPEHGELCRVIETQTLWGETKGRTEL